MAPVKALTSEQVCRRCDPARFPFETTESLEPLAGALGQDRAVEALRFGARMRQEGYNLFVMGPPESGRHTLVHQILEARAAEEPVPDDVCYVSHFGQPHRPRALRLPPGKGVELQRDVEGLVEDLGTAIPAALESEEHRARRHAIAEDLKARHEAALAELRKVSEARGIALLRTPIGFAFAPMRDGEVLTPDEFEKLSEEERKRMQAEMEGLQDRLREFIATLPRIEKELRERLRALDRETTLTAVGHQIDALRAKWTALPQIVAHLDALQQDVLENVPEFTRPRELQGDGGPSVPDPEGLEGPGISRRYRVNVLVDHSATKGAPVVYENHPSYHNLIGRVEYAAQMGALVTDFNLVKGGALHRANGGYLVLDAHALLMQPYAWEGLKRALKAREVRIESLGQMLSLVSTVSLEPEPIPLQAKVVLVGERIVYYLLDRYDPEFHALFKVPADFEEDLARTESNDLLYARLIATLARAESLLPLDRTGVAAVVERSARLAGDAVKLSTSVGRIADLLREADFCAKEAGRSVVGDEDVQRAVEAQERREGRVKDRVLEEIRRGTFLIDTQGEKVGQVNGLAVYEHGHLLFGRPTRITAKVRLGRGEVVDIEREVELGGPIHSKGVLILAGFLGSRYAKDHPLSLAATLVFEQSYGPVEGDSASSAELYALLSALAEIPIRQSLAVTGSVNQHGQVQAIGGVNEKVEGFFDVCSARGLTGEQGVLVPASNVEHLMLRRDVVAAVERGRFHVYPIATVDEGIELLTGVPAGQRDATGKFPWDSVNQRVETRLVALAERRIQLGADGRGGGKEAGR